MSLKQMAYMLTASIIAIIALIGWTLLENHRHQAALADAVVFRQKEVNQFLRTEVCERLELRDEIQISYLRAVARKWDAIDPDYASVMADAARALELTQKGCRENLPSVENVRPVPGG